MAVSEVLFFVGSQSTGPTVACAIGNIVPALTFAIAAALRMEAVRLGTLAGKAKVAGTLVCVGGSMIMPLYKGPLLKVPASPVHWRYAEHAAIAAMEVPPASTGLGDALVILSTAAWAAWLVMQNKASDAYTSTTIMPLTVSLECTGISAAVDRSLSVWNLGLGIRLYTVLYTGIVGWGVTFALMTWCIQARGPLFVSMFNPVMLVVVAVLRWAVLDEQLHVGSAIGSALIVGGLYMVLWGKRNEMSRPAALVDGKSEAEITAKGPEPKSDTANSSSLPV